MEKTATLAILIGVVGALLLIYLVSTEPVPSKFLSLSISTNTTSIAQNGSIGYSVEIINKLNYSIYLSLANDWPKIKGLGYPGEFDICSLPGLFPIYVTMFKGNYSLINLSSTAQSLDPTNVKAEGILSCPPLIPARILFYELAASNNKALVYVFTEYLTTRVNTYNITAGYNQSAIGYWVGPNDTFYNFSPGTYTLVAGDEWNQTALTHFKVT